MYHKHHTRGIVISGRNDRDDGRYLNIFTENFGLIGAKAQGARNLRSKFRAGLQDFSSGEFSLVSGKNGWRIVSVRPEKNFFEIFRSDRGKIKIAGNIFNLIKKLVGEDKNQNKLFHIVLNFFHFMETTKTNEIALAECLTLVRMLHALGYMKSDPEVSLPVSSSEISASDLSMISPRRAAIVNLINESLKAA